MSSSPVSNNECDILILGASMAGSCLARQLKLKWPELHIINIDKKTSFDYWVGEATVPPWADYAVRHCGLGPYLWKNHLMKHGLRFFFDSPEKDLHLWEMSEFGRKGYPIIASFQLDRSIFDRDLCAMNRDLGIDVRLGTSVSRPSDRDQATITIDRDNGHIVPTSDGPVRCRWLVDATGRQAIIAHQLDLLEPDWQRLPTNAFWARFINTRNIDSLGDDAWRFQAGYSERNLSTNHYMYEGYWIWHIPVDENTISLGVTLHEDMCPEKFRDANELLAFFRRHQCLRDLLGDDAQPIDFYGLTRLARHSRQFGSTDRWFMTGLSAAFIDPLFSSHCMSVAAHNLLIESMIEADREGRDDIFASRVAHFNVFHEVFHEANLSALDYKRHGCFDGWAPYRLAMLNNIVNWAPPIYYRDLRDLVAMADGRVGLPAPKARDLLAMKVERGYSGAIRRRKNEFIDFLSRHEAYYSRNQRQYLDGTPRAGARKHLWSGLDDTAVIADKKREDVVSYTELVRYYVARMAELEGIPWDEEAFVMAFNPDVSADQSLEDILQDVRRQQAESVLQVDTA